MTLRRSKTDQEGQGRKVGIPCSCRTRRRATFALFKRGLQPLRSPDGIVVPVAESAWPNATGPVVRHRRRARGQETGSTRGAGCGENMEGTAYGLDTLPPAAIAGASGRSIMNQTGHRSVQMVRRYIRDGSLFRENSAGKLGLATTIERLSGATWTGGYSR